MVREKRREIARRMDRGGGEELKMLNTYYYINVMMLYVDDSAHSWLAIDSTMLL